MSGLDSNSKSFFYFWGKGGKEQLLFRFATSLVIEDQPGLQRQRLLTIVIFAAAKSVSANIQYRCNEKICSFEQRIHDYILTLAVVQVTLGSHGTDCGNTRSDGIG
jgi:hypothetical protein